MGLPSDVQLISVDDHVIEHERVWLDRLPTRFADAAPQIVEIEGGRQAWRYEGIVFPQVGLNAVAGKDPSQFNTDPVRFEDMRPGCFDPTERLKDMTMDGVWGSLNFPSFPRFCGQRFLEAKDKDLALLCVQAYNDFMIDEWCAADPQRLIPMGIFPLWDVGLAVSELERVAARGMKAMTFSENFAPLGLPSIHSGHWDPLFASAQAADIPLCMHIGSSSKMIDTSDDAPYPVHIVLNGLNSVVAAADILCSRVLQNFPTLKFALSEGGAGWVPYFLEKVRYTWARHGLYGGLDQTLAPDEAFRRHFAVCFIEDFLAVELRDEIGIETLMWECDYPHADTAWPNSRTLVEKMLADVPDAQARKIGEDNARRFFNFPRVSGS
jgi:predicted TIM-barrel fold metal-dependent hydrolase